jgi:hypothetical protein
MQTRSYGGGGGPIDATVEEIQSLLVLDNLDDSEKLIESFDAISNRHIFSIFEEFNQQDRRALDEVVFDALGLTKGERDGVYDAVIRLVEDRLNKASSFKR